MNKYRKKPVVIEAVQWTGKNGEEITKFISINTSFDIHDDVIEINTLEGTMLANIGDYVIKGINGEFYPCKPDIFEKTYEKVENE